MKTLFALLAAAGVLAGCVVVPATYDQNVPVVVRSHDRDHDGIPNRHDRDRDGDGVPNRQDAAPNNPNRY